MAVLRKGVLLRPGLLSTVGWGVVPTNKVSWNLHRGVVDFPHTPSFSRGSVVTQLGHLIHSMDKFQLTVSGLGLVPGQACHPRVPFRQKENGLREWMTPGKSVPLLETKAI